MLAGRRMARAFGVRAPYLRPVATRWFVALVVPHPSGANSWWNDGANGKAAARAIKEAIRWAQTM